jgi:hypothetical protein
MAGDISFAAVLSEEPLPALLSGNIFWLAMPSAK